MIVVTGFVLVAVGTLDTGTGLVAIGTVVWVISTGRGVQVGISPDIKVAGEILVASI
jgi:altronate dehydratase